MAIKVSGTEVISDDKRILNNEDLPDIRPSLLLDFANSKTLDPRITFTRGSTATYWDGKTTAKAEENLVTQSQGFDNVVWYKDGTTITANDTAAPDGTTTADRITDSGVGTSHYAAHTLAISTSATYSISCYIKYGGGNGWVLVGFTGAVAGAYFDIQNGTTGSTGSSVSGSSITDVGGGWYRCELQTTYTLSPAYPQVRLVPSNGTATYTADGSYVWAWGFQVEQRSSATAYTPTTTSPIVKYQPVLQTAASGEARFDHDPVTGESKGLLIEEARTNLLTYSEDFSQSYWSKSNTNIVSNTTVAPDGTLTGTKVIATAVLTYHQVDRFSAHPIGSSEFTTSVFLKAGEQTKVRILLLPTTPNDFNNHAYANIDLSTGVVASTLRANASIIDVGNGWYRCTVTSTQVTSSSSTDVQVAFSFVNNDYTSVNLAGDGYSGFYIWGAQLEEGSFPTSYIPTSGSTVTRATDSAEITGTNFSSWYAQGEGSLYAKVTQFTSADYTVRLSDSSGSNRIELLGFSGQQFGISFNGVSYSLDAGQPLDNIEYEIVASYKADDIAACIDGGAVSESTSALIPYVDKMEISVLSSESHYIKKLAYYPKRLPNATLQAMTEA